MTISELEKSISDLPFEIPSGLLIGSEAGAEYYLSDSRPPPGLWSRLRAQHRRSGLWPVFLRGHDSGLDHPWVDEDPRYGRSRHPDDYDAGVVLLQQWQQLAESNFLLPRGRANFFSRTAPFDGIWPGLAAPAAPEVSPEAAADELAGRLIRDPGARLGLMPVERGADVPVAAEWWAGEELDTGAAAAVLRSWEDRFGARVVQLGYDSLELSVAAPARDLDQAVRVAAEHFALCVENVGRERDALSHYAEELVGARHWSFWWSREEPDWLDWLDEDQDQDEDEDELRPTDEETL